MFSKVKIDIALSVHAIVQYFKIEKRDLETIMYFFFPLESYF